MTAFVANVGVNSAHAAFSPLFADGTFQLLPIPERLQWRRPMLRAGDIARVAEYAPPSWKARPVHLDPDLHFSTPTYGDNCRRVGRAFSLRHAKPGDAIFFLARLQPAAEPAGFYLVGSLEVAEILPDVTAEPGPGWWDGNAHIRRARATGTWDSFWIFRGTASSRLFERAVPFLRQDLETLFGSVIWRSGRSELQTIGSYTRSVRRIEGRGEQWLRTTCQS